MQQCVCVLQHKVSRPVCLNQLYESVWFIDQSDAYERSHAILTIDAIEGLVISD